jgi:predicted ATPase
MSTRSINGSSLSDAVRLDLSDKDLFGRENDIKILQDSLERITHDAGTPELLLVTGASGTGKSSLIKAALKTRTRHDKGGLFIHGKFDQFSSEGSGSFSAALEALNELCELVDRREDRDELVRSIKQALGNESGRLSTFIPGLRDLFDDEEQKEHGGTAAEKIASSGRFVPLSCALIRSIASIERPIVLFIDDLQWSDGDTLKLVHSLFTNEDMEGLLVVGAYRDDEIDYLHPVFATLKKITEIESRVTKVAVACLTEVTVNELVAFATELRMDQTEPLSRLIHRKTLGNCFFVTQFLEMLQDDGLLRYSFVSYQWEWTLDNIAAKTTISENAVDLVVNRISKLDLRAQEIFKIAGCLGSQFTIDVLKVICCTIMAERLGVEAEGEMPANPVAVRSRETNVAVGKLLSMRLVERSRGDWIKFSHDRIQQAAESWVQDEQEKLAFRLQIGRILKDHLQSEDVKNNKECVVADWLFFTAVDLLNKGSQLISMQQEKHELITLNRTAAAKASKRFAFLPAAVYNEASITLCGESLWIESPALAMELHDAAATCYIKCGKCVRSFELAQQMVWHASSPQSRLRGQSIQLHALEQQGRFDDGAGLGMAMLRSLGERLPQRPNMLHVIRGYLRTKRIFQKFSDGKLLNLPAMTDKTQILICKMSQSVSQILFFAKNKDVLPLLWFRIIEKTIAFGVSAHSCAAFSFFAMFLGHVNDNKSANRVSRLSLSMCEKFGDNRSVTVVHICHYYMCHHLRDPIQSAIDPLMNAYTLGMRVGSVQPAFLSAFCSCAIYFYSGLTLEHVEHDLRKLTTATKEYNSKVVVDIAVPLYQVVLILTGSDNIENPLELTGRAMHEEAFLTELKETGNLLFGELLFVTWKLLACAFLGNSHEETLALHQRLFSKRFARRGDVSLRPRQSNFYGALAAMALFKQSRKRRHRRYSRRIALQMERFVKEGAGNCVHMHLILQAEMMTWNKNNSPEYRQEVRRAFDKAINTASRNGFCQHAGMANERAATYHSEFDAEQAEYYWHQAFGRYEDWGAGRKLVELAKLHPCLKEKGRMKSRASAVTGTRGGRANARSRFNDNAANEQRSMTFG